jgi:hypothetical protein
MKTFAACITFVLVIGSLQPPSHAQQTPTRGQRPDLSTPEGVLS